MNIDIKNLISVDSPGNSKYIGSDDLYRKVTSVAQSFGFSYLPDEIKIHLHICEKNAFENVKKKTDFNGNEMVIAFTFNVNHIYIIQYQDIEDRFTEEFYTAVIVHECVHIFQFYYSRRSLTDYAWLYESIACYLSGQSRKYEIYDNCSWTDFTSDFYHVKNCYALAYSFGEILFKTYSTVVLDIIKYPELYEKSLKRIFDLNFFKPNKMTKDSNFQNYVMIEGEY